MNIVMLGLICFLTNGGFHEENFLGSNLERAAFSTIIRESNDYTVVLLDANGDSLAENRATIGAFAGCLPRTMKHLLKIFPLESWMQGDVVISNDPWIGTGHRPDVTVVAPIFYGTTIIGFTGNTGHWADIGGAIFSADTKSVFEEGIGLPPMKSKPGIRRYVGSVPEPCSLQSRS